MKIGIIGSGYVGLVTGTCFSSLGHQVICVDKDPSKLEALLQGKSPIYEPGLEELMQESIQKNNLSFTDKIEEAVEACEVLFICVNTPPKEDGGADLSYVENVSREIAERLTSYRLIVGKSTVPVNTGEWISKTVKSIQPDESLFDVASNPEFLREGTAVEDFLHPDRVVLGVSNEKAEKLLRELYAPFESKIVVTDIKSAELIKHASNSFLATKIAFINGVSRICEAAGADVEQVAQGMGLDPRIGPNFLRAGIGFGGFCFPKDLAAFSHMADQLGVPFGLLKSVLQLNDEQQELFIKKIESNMWNLKDKVMGVLGLSFKPDTDDTRFSPAIKIIKALQQQGCKIQAYDPQAMERAKAELNDVDYKASAYEAIEGADALVVLTEWKEFVEIDLKKVKSLLKQPVVFDGRNIYSPDQMKELGFQYHRIGRRPLEPCAQS